MPYRKMRSGKAFPWYESENDGSDALLWRSSSNKSSKHDLPWSTFACAVLQYNQLTLYLAALNEWW